MWMCPNIGGLPPKSFILIGICIINHPFWGTPISGNTPCRLCLTHLVLHLLPVAGSPCAHCIHCHIDVLDSVDGSGTRSRCATCRHGSHRENSLYSLFNIAWFAWEKSGLDATRSQRALRCSKSWRTATFKNQHVGLPQKSENFEKCHGLSARCYTETEGPCVKKHFKHVSIAVLSQVNGGERQRVFLKSNSKDRWRVRKIVI